MLQQYLHPIEEKKFFSDYWEKKPLLVQHQTSKKHSELFSMEEFDELFCRRRLSHTSVRIQGQGNFGFNYRDFLVLHETWQHVSLSPHLLKLSNFYEKGYSLMLNSAEQYCPPLRDFVECLSEKIPSFEVRSYVFFNPENATGLPIHCDEEELFVIQLEGSKHWKVYDRDPQYEFEGKERDPSAPWGDPKMEFELKAGDFLYLPRGFPHEVHAAGEPSLHVSFAVRLITWSDLLQSVASVSSYTSSRGNPLVPFSPFYSNKASGIHDMTVEDFEKCFQEKVSSLFEESSLKRGVEHLQFSYKGTMRPNLDGQLDVLDRLDDLLLDSSLAQRKGASSGIRKHEGRLQLYTNFKLKELTREQVEAYFYIQSAEKFKVKELPDSLTNEEKLKFVRLLIMESILVFSE
jgi:ribosomal protein L16 Arg81 hydroxylase